MTYEEALNEIHSLSRFGSKLGLSRMKRLMELLGNPQDAMKVIHVAGTNGKGSTCRYLYSVLKEEGYKAGLYTSPFLEAFNERIEFDGSPISDEDLAECTAVVLEKVRSMVEAGEESPTEFEVVTAIAFVYFSRRDMDYLVLEVGLGGRGDSTNIVRKPLVSVITSISFDHMEYLGDTLEKIALEKAGIFKEGCPAVYAIKDPGAAMAVREAAKQKGCEAWDVLGTAGEPWISDLAVTREDLLGTTFSVTVGGEAYANAELSMVGRHQVENACVALSVIEILKRGNQLKIDKNSVYSGLKGARQTGRFEVLRREPWVIIDGAHNDDGVRALSAVLRQQLKGKKILLICGILADKEVGRMVDAFGALGVDFAATEPDNPRKMSSGELCRLIREKGYSCEDAGADWQAIDYGVGKLSDYDAVVYAGSLYLIGKIREGFPK